MLAAMLWGGRTYYVKTNEEGLSVGDQEIHEALLGISSVPILKIFPQKEHELDTLEALMNTPVGLSKDVLIRSLMVSGALEPGTNPRSTATYMRVTRWLDPMVERGFVAIHGERKDARIRLTDPGRDAAHLLVSPWKQPEHGTVCGPRPNRAGPGFLDFSSHTSNR